MAFLFVIVSGKVEIADSCGISKAFLKKRLFYLSEVKGTEYFADGDRMVAYDAGKTRIFEVWSTHGDYTEITNCCHIRNQNYVEEPETEKSHYKNWADAMLRWAVYFGIGWNVTTFVAWESFYLPYLIGLLFIIIARFGILYAIWEADDVELEEQGIHIKNAVLYNYLDLTFKRAYPLFQFRDKKGLHLVYGREKMPIREIQQKMGKEYEILYAPGKVAGVKLQTKQELSL